MELLSGLIFSTELRVHSFGVIGTGISDLRSLGLWCIKGTSESTLVTDSSVPLTHHDPLASDLGSLILIILRKAPLVSIFRSYYFPFCSLFLEWYWRVWVLPSLLRITAVLLFLLSVTLVWSEVTFFNAKPVLSIFAQMIHSASEGYYYFYVEVCTEK